MANHYSVAIAVAKKDFDAAYDFAKKITPHFVNIRTIETPDDLYYVFYWEDHPWIEDGAFIAESFIEWLDTVRHAAISIGDHGVISVDIKTEDDAGCDDMFNELLSWRGDILVADKDVPVLTPSYQFGREERCGIEADRLAQMFQDYVMNDVQSADHDYIRDVLYDICGCSDEELEAVGLGFLIREAHEEDTPDGIIIQDNEAGLLAIDRAVKVEWVNCDEGIHGDYNPKDPDDINLLRFDVYLARDGSWVQVDDASYCTNMPADTPRPILKKALLYLLKEYSNVLNSDPEQSVKKMGEGLSWICPEWFEAEFSEDLTPTKDQNKVTFGMTWEVFAEQTIDLPDEVDKTDEDAVKEYIRENWENVPVPENSGTYIQNSDVFDETAPVTIS